MNPVILETFHSLGSMVEKTDYWRYLIVYYFGGIYADSDVEALVAIRDWECWGMKEKGDDRGIGSGGAGGIGRRFGGDVKMVVGIEGVFKNDEDRRRERFTHIAQFAQWTFVKTSEIGSELRGRW